MAANRKISGSIRTKILFWFLVISIPPALGIVIAGYWRSRELVEEQTTELLASTVDMVTK
ncbi:MAG: hypothetical protein HYW14_00210, partial [Planctomycetes bacterium]|nr:hypothetical protein [Planctomycetota bacterium]